MIRDGADSFPSVVAFGAPSRRSARRPRPSARCRRSEKPWRLASIKSPKKSTQLDVQKRAGLWALGASPAPDKGTPPCRKQNAHGSRFRDALAIVPPGACNPSGIALSIVEAWREICEHKPTASTAHDPAIPLMVYLSGISAYETARAC